LIKSSVVFSKENKILIKSLYEKKLLWFTQTSEGVSAEKMDAIV